MATRPTPAEDHAEHQPWMTAEHRAYVVERMAEQGIPYCFECHDWHHPDEPHSTFP